ncbi:MAG: hypothetical protein JEZ11_28230 [Desulfobacterales bacterium]|nr:hypothetical protein [Desulfobacterales bacterium]
MLKRTIYAIFAFFLVLHPAFAFQGFDRWQGFDSWSSASRGYMTTFTSSPSWLSGDITVSGGAASKTVSFYAPTLSSGNLTVGKVYEITARSTVDFTADGSADNTVGTIFVATGTSVTLDASNTVVEKSLSATNLITNGGFETAGAGGADVFAGWIEDIDGGSISDETGIVHYGSHSCKLTSVGTYTRINKEVTVSPLEYYVLSAYIYDDGSHPGRIQIYDITNSALVASYESMNIVGTTYTRFNYVFQAPAGCAAIRAGYTCPDTSTASVYIDDVELRQVLDGAELLTDPGFDAPTLSSGNLTVGKVYEITARSTADFTADGAYDNNVGTKFVATGTSVTLDASNTVVEKSLSATNMVQVPGGSGYYINGNFETLGAGGADVFVGWYEILEDGAIASDTGHYGTYSAKLTCGAVVKNTRAIKYDITCEAGKSYYFSFWTKGDGTNAGRWLVYFQSGGQSVSNASTGVTGTDWVKVQNVLKSTVNTKFNVGIVCPTTEGGSAYFDDVEVREVLDGAEPWTAGTGWSVADGVAISDGSQVSNSDLYCVDICPEDTLYRVECSALSVSDGAVSVMLGGYHYALSMTSAGTKKVTDIAEGNGRFYLRANSTLEGSVESASCVGISLPLTFSTANLPGAKKVRTTPTVAGSEWAGAVMCLDDRDNPANFVVAFIDNGDTDDLKMYKVVAGTWTRLIDTNVTYSAGAPLEIRRVNDVFSVYYNGSQVGASQTITGMTGKYHGIFATGSESTFDSLRVE